MVQQCPADGGVVAGRDVLGAGGDGWCCLECGCPSMGVLGVRPCLSVPAALGLL